MSSIRDFISHASAQKIALDAKIIELQATLEKLHLEREELCNQIRRHEGSLSPLRRMPPEVLSAIFALTFCLYDFGPTVSAPWTASAVCARWRNIALSPDFWTTIDTKDAHFNSGVPALETHLIRSGDLPLRIHFFSEAQYRISDVDSWMIDVLAEHAARWENVTLVGPEKICSRIQLTVSQFPLLRKLKLKVARTMDFHQIPSPSTALIFSCAPQLKDVFVDHGLGANPLTFVLPWQQLSTYRASSEWSALHNLASAVNLIQCTLDMTYDWNHEPAVLNIGVILLPRLLRLSVSHHKILTCLETPALTELYDCEWGPISGTLIFRRLPHTLRKLVVASRADGASISLTSAVEALPQIRHLGFIHILPMQSLRTFLASLLKRAPTLERVSLMTNADVETIASVVEDMEAMDWGTHRLRSFTFRRDSRDERVPLTRNMCDRLELLRGRGVDIEIVDYFNFYRGLVPENFRTGNPHYE